ncbi:Uncharacterised protein [Mycobacteroides abscessus subsp. abscessus]|nr:Uncharacterised protein [Mycobacteroides abscessus subsp. abscessus]
MAVWLTVTTELICRPTGLSFESRSSIRSRYHPVSSALVISPHSTMWWNASTVSSSWFTFVSLS